ncbi:hypothetical protein JZ751_018624 [Albula glossodonta]|uniref:Uncharacterized protein n=1 Tax=Albula glossodonta TaxID=121402 RepID=A0A8T2MZU6_9TELE|nr:hypothetical protein JZ751_018624 [Albula glossodonta]
MACSYPHLWAGPSRLLLVANWLWGLRGATERQSEGESERAVCVLCGEAQALAAVLEAGLAVKDLDSETCHLPFDVIISGHCALNNRQDVIAWPVQCAVGRQRRSLIVRLGQRFSVRTRPESERVVTEPDPNLTGFLLFMSEPDPNLMQLIPTLPSSPSLGSDRTITMRMAHKCSQVKVSSGVSHGGSRVGARNTGGCGVSHSPAPEPPTQVQNGGLDRA